MNHGVKKQLDFDNLLQLPTDMDTTCSQDTLLRSWQSQCTSDCSNPSLFMAICHAYGWPYLCLGLLKVARFCGTSASYILEKHINQLEFVSKNLSIF